VPAQHADGSASVQMHNQFAYLKASAPGSISAWRPGVAGTGRGHAGTCTSMWSRAALPTADPPATRCLWTAITPWEAALGAESTPPTGRVEVKVPAGSAAGRSCVIRRGLPATGSGELPGDFTSRCASCRTLAGDVRESPGLHGWPARSRPLRRAHQLNHERGFTDTQRQRMRHP
jgi:hypothetical protein